MQTVTISATQKTLREQYTEARKKLGTQAEVAASLEVTRQCIHRRECGKSRVTAEAWRALQHLAADHGCNGSVSAVEARPVTAPAKPSPIVGEMTEEEMQAKYADFVSETRNTHWRGTVLLGTLDGGKTYDIEAKNKGQLGLVIYAQHLSETFAKYFPGAVFSVSEAKN